MGVRIIGTGHYVPPGVLTNSDLEKMVDTSDEWITTRTGISKRHIAPPEMKNSDMACEAARAAIEQAGIRPEEISFIICSTVSPDRIFPSTACLLQAKLHAVNAFCYDLEAACSGLIFNLETARALLLANPQKYRYGLILGTEKLSAITDWSDRSTCILFGDASAAILLENRENEPDFMLASCLGSDGTYGDMLQIPAGGSARPATHETVDAHDHFIHMSGQETFKLAVRSMVNSSRTVLEQSGVSPDQLAWVIPHQANQRILIAAGARLSIPAEKIYINMNQYGNTSSASIGICLDELNRSGQLKRGDYLLLTSFGGGVTWGSQLIRW